MMMLRWASILVGAFDLGLLSAALYVSRDRERIIRLGPPPAIFEALLSISVVSMTLVVTWGLFVHLKAPFTPFAFFAFASLVVLGVSLCVWLRWAARRRRRLAGHDPNLPEAEPRP